MTRKKAKAPGARSCAEANAESPEFARTDADLIIRFQRIFDSVSGAPPFKLPAWLATVPGCDGDPSQLGRKKRTALRDNRRLPHNDNEERLKRNLAVVEQVLADLEHAKNAGHVIDAALWNAIIKAVAPPFITEANTEVARPPVQKSNTHNPELATCDSDLTTCLKRTFDQAKAALPLKLPVWLTTIRGCDGDPSEIERNRLSQLRDSNYLPLDDNEKRYIRNRAVVKQVIADVERAAEGDGPDVSTLKDAILEAISLPQKARNATAEVHPQLPTGFFQRREAPPTGQVPPSLKGFFSRTGQSTERDSSTTALVGTKGSTPQTRNSISDNDRAEAARLKATVLAPFYQRIHRDGSTIMRLTVENNELARALRLQESRTHSVGDATVAIARDHQRGRKRRAEEAFNVPTNRSEEVNSHQEHDMNVDIQRLVKKISKDLDKPAAVETIQLCGLAPLRIISDTPDDVLNLAYSKLNTLPFHQVKVCWRRLYEDASLHKAVQLLRAQSGYTSTPDIGSSKRGKYDDGTFREDWIAEVILVLDKGATLSGAPGRKTVFEAAFKQLEAFIDDSVNPDLPRRFDIRRPEPLHSEYGIPRAREALGIEAFQNHLNNATTPLIIPGTLSEWPASQRWHSPAYFLQLTMGGRRIVPIEIGKSYTEAGWTQRVMTFGHFMRTFLLPAEPEEIGYLAQHDLFAQIPALRNDVVVPDYCYTTPPEPDADVLKTAGLQSAKQLDEPMLNAWLGPKGTKTPLHTDPYHNILCQVVGYKYVRLYAPSETPKLYPLGPDDKGVDMSNTSQLDISHARMSSLKGSSDLDGAENVHGKFPLFAEAKYEEAILGPGECLYVPLGWWHYVESLSTSFSVSFWWN